VNTKFIKPPRGTQQGSVLLEALIAFLIFSIGILGVIGLQATTINNTLDARYRTDAAFLANQIIAQIWADSRSSFDPATGLARYDIQGTYACNACTSTNGNTNTRAWVAQIQSGFLPGVTDTTNQPSIAISGAQVTVTMNWQSPQNQSVRHNYVTRTEIQFNQPQP
jgi:type IV pilus assembly protein PilV